MPYVASENQSREAARPTREVVRVVGRVPVGRGQRRVEVRRQLPVGRERQRRISVQQRARVVRREQPLVRVHDERVGPLDTVEQRPDGRRQERRASVGAVHVEPESAVGADVRDAGEVVDGPGVRRSGARHDGEHAVAAVGLERRSRAHHRSAVPRASWGTESTSTSITRAADVHAGVRGVARGEPPSARAGRPRRSAAVCRAVTSDERFPAEPPDTKTPPRSGGQPGQVGDPPKRLVLRPDGARAVDPAGRDRGRRAHDQVEQDRRTRRGARDERERRRVIGRDRGRRQHVGPEAERFLPPDPVGRDRLTGERIELFGASRVRSSGCGRAMRSRAYASIACASRSVSSVKSCIGSIWATSCATDGPARRAGPWHYRIRTVRQPASSWQKPSNASMYFWTSSSVCCTEIVHCSSSPGVMNSPRLIIHENDA